MLNPLFPAPSITHKRCTLAARQGGVVLMIALIILVALTIGGIALVRSVSTTSIIAGNLAFQQAATISGDAGTEAAIRSIELGNPLAMSTIALQSDNFARAYSASTPAAGNPANWDTYWSTDIDPLPAALPGTCENRVCALPVDAVGNTVSYTIQRLCQTAGDPALLPTGCASRSQLASQSGGSLGSGNPQMTQVPQYYYRVTSRIAGPRNTISYIQTIVAR
ncbi:MAG: pilus assembly PilX N-terminal domain-containing protein [Propionivibrio sp.]|nr:pilus assembly PilX N-terminal domain-containing protein [Propionivibrio sp.]